MNEKPPSFMLVFNLPNLYKEEQKNIYLGLEKGKINKNPKRESISCGVVKWSEREENLSFIKTGGVISEDFLSNSEGSNGDVILGFSLSAAAAIWVIGYFSTCLGTSHFHQSRFLYSSYNLLLLPKHSLLAFFHHYRYSELINQFSVSFP